VTRTEKGTEKGTETETEIETVGIGTATTALVDAAVLRAIGIVGTETGTATTTGGTGTETADIATVTGTMTGVTATGIAAVMSTEIGTGSESAIGVVTSVIRSAQSPRRTVRMSLATRPQGLARVPC
jgi:hypothetical protein